MTDGIHIPRDVADTEGVPSDLDAGLVGPYRFPDPRRRKIAAIVYVATAVVVVMLGGGRAGSWVVVGLLAGLATWHAASAWPLADRQEAILRKAGALVSFPVGHASAAVAFRGLRARPVWQVIVYSADDPPTTRALVQLDGVTGHPVGEIYTESIPSP